MGNNPIDYNNILRGEYLEWEGQKTGIRIKECMKEALRQALPIVLEYVAERARLDLGEHGVTDQYLATDELLNEFGITVSESSITGQEEELITLLGLNK